MVRLHKQRSRAIRGRRQKKVQEAEGPRGGRSPGGEAATRGFTLSFMSFLQMETFWFYDLQARDLCHRECAVKLYLEEEEGEEEGMCACI